uniref:Ubiquitin-like domain-containing protein n=1 Tax=Crocodylus porosus TaxID=8502 RepID=A0A7M4DW91_CROPO
CATVFESVRCRKPKIDFHSEEGILPEGQVVLLGSTPLEDNAIIGQCGTSNLCTLEVNISMMVGMAHARKEGKRPPMVAKQKKMGCAKWCIWYNCCFVNTMSDFGKKGPNTNS